MRRWEVERRKRKRGERGGRLERRRKHIPFRQRDCQKSVRMAEKVSQLYQTTPDFGMRWKQLSDSK